MVCGYVQDKYAYKFVWREAFLLSVGFGTESGGANSRFRRMVRAAGRLKNSWCSFTDHDA